MFTQQTRQSYANLRFHPGCRVLLQIRVAVVAGPVVVPILMDGALHDSEILQLCHLYVRIAYPVAICIAAEIIRGEHIGNSQRRIFRGDLGKFSAAEGDCSAVFGEARSDFHRSVEDRLARDGQAPASNEDLRIVGLISRRLIAEHAAERAAVDLQLTGEQLDDAAAVDVACEILIPSPYILY